MGALRVLCTYQIFLPKTLEIRYPYAAFLMVQALTPIFLAK